MLEFRYDPATDKAVMKLGRPGGKVVTRPVPQPPPGADKAVAEGKPRKRRPRR